MGKGWVNFVLVSTLAVTILLPAIAQQQTGWLQRRRGNFFIQHFVSELNLTADQRMQIKGVLQRERPVILAIFQKSEQHNAQLRARNTFDEAFVRSIAKQQAQNWADAFVERENIRAQIFAALTPEQQQKFNQMGDEFRISLQQRIVNLGDQL
jgi:Spy/CpxP family protein refolding chaperone